MTDAEWDALIASEAAKAKSKTVDGVTTVRRDLRELQDAADRQRLQSAVSPENIVDTLRGMTLQIVPPGGP